MVASRASEELATQSVSIVASSAEHPPLNDLPFGWLHINRRQSGENERVDFAGLAGRHDGLARRRVSAGLDG